MLTKNQENLVKIFTLMQGQDHMIVSKGFRRSSPYSKSTYTRIERIKKNRFVISNQTYSRKVSGNERVVVL
jgi:hypothetical protein